MIIKIMRKISTGKEEKRRNGNIEEREEAKREREGAEREGAKA